MHVCICICICVSDCVCVHVRMMYKVYTCIMCACVYLCCVCTYIYEMNVLSLCKLYGLVTGGAGCGTGPGYGGIVPGPAQGPDSSKYD